MTNISCVCYINCINTTNTVGRGGEEMIHPDYKSGKTLHEQIEEEIKQHIINGILKPDEQLPSVRELSISLTVNPNTVQRAYKQLEQDGFIYSIKGKGNFVANAAEKIGDARKEALIGELRAAIRELCFLGTDKSELCKIIEKIYSEKEEQL